MRLLNIHTLEFTEFHGDNIPPYLITSHRWTANEATYKDVLKKRNRNSEGFQKIVRFCGFAKRWADPGATIEWIWIDTCCINQNSSAEVSESINSMWSWYTKARHGVAFLKDVRGLSAGWDAVMFDFRRSEWFERGWTLQELLAPRCVVFLTHKFEVIGRKSADDHACPMAPQSLNRVITEITGIPQETLCNFQDSRRIISKETKMSWAANRLTTKVEDAAYCLLGIFDVHMPLIYGEGERNARKRLEREIATVEQDDFLEGRETELLSSRLQSMQVVPTSERTSLSRHNATSEITGAHLCQMCNSLLLDPIQTSCDHKMCHRDWFRLNIDRPLRLAYVPLELGGQLHGDAAVQNFQIRDKCPVCNKYGRDKSAFSIKVATNLAQELLAKYPRTHSQREAELEGQKVISWLTINIGNWHETVGVDRHQWTFFLKPNRTDIIENVHIHLHQTFKQPHVVLMGPPFSFDGRGWGYFEINLNINLKPGYVWFSPANVADPQSPTSLKLSWTLDFQSYNGRGAMGRCCVPFGRAKDWAAAMTQLRGTERSTYRLHGAPEQSAGADSLSMDDEVL